MNADDTKRIQAQDGVVFSAIKDGSFEGIMVYDQNKMTKHICRKPTDLSVG